MCCQRYCASLRLELLCAVCISACLSQHAWGAGRATSPPPTYANFAYGAHPRNVLDFWKAESPAPTPLVIFIHGGGFQSFSKERIRPRDVRQLLANGISVAAINYRYVQTDPLPACFFDARKGDHLFVDC